MWYRVVFFLFFCVMVNGFVYQRSNKFPIRFLRSAPTGCILPPHPKNGKWSVVDSSGIEWSPNMTLPSGKFLQILCNDNYTLQGDFGIMNCQNNAWTNEMSQCLKKCPQLNNTPHLNITCYDKNEKKIECSDAAEGSNAAFRCDRFYKLKSTEEKHSRQITCSNGTWESKVPECILACGKNKFIDPAMVINGTDAKKGAYPWQVAIYDGKTKELICGGSLLNQRVVLTAAHCLSIYGQNFENAISLSVDNYYSQYNHSEDTSAQFDSVETIYLPERYQGRVQNYKNDIAIIITKEKFTLTENVQPICIDWNSEYLETAIQSTNNGSVAGWGYTHENSKPATVLQELKVVPVEYTSCFQDLPHSFRKFLTRDKICAGHLNKSMAVCKGDSGGGLFFKHNDRFYVSAIVSVAPASSRALTDSCDSQQYSLYTNVSYHRKFIAEKLAFAEELDEPDDLSGMILLSPKLELKKCFLPEHPNFGYWSTEDFSEYYEPLPGHPVKSGTQLKLRCHGEYFLEGSSNVKCENESWTPAIGKCLKTCPSIYNTRIMKVHCAYPNGSISTNTCVNAVDGTVAHFECALFYEDFSLSRNSVGVCLDGKWDQTPPECSPACGKLGNDPKKKKVFPWHVSIYTSTDKTLICSGSLISEKVVVTAAYCVIDEAGNLKSKDSLLVTVGNRYRMFNDLRDSEYIQISEINFIFMPKSSKKPHNNRIVQDLAILVTRKTFRLTKRVLPVCLDSQMMIDRLPYNKYLYVAGWGYNIDQTNHPDRLKTIKILKGSLTQCKALTEFENKFSLLEDKICAGYIDNGSMVCYGDIGAGLVFQHEKRYYLGGTLSLSPNFPSSIGSCNRQEFSVYTRISSYLTFIFKKEAEFRATWSN